MKNSMDNINKINNYSEKNIPNKAKTLQEKKLIRS